MVCEFILCHIAVTWSIAESFCNVPSSMGPVHRGTKPQVACIWKKFSHGLANLGVLQGRWEYSNSTPWPLLQALLKAGLWVTTREDVEAHLRLLVRPVLNWAVEVFSGEVAEVNVARDQNPEKFSAYHGSVSDRTAQ